MILNYFKRLCLILVMNGAFFASAQTAGDLMFVGFNADGNDGYAFVTLIDLPNGTVIRFTDNEWNGNAVGGTGAFNDQAEGEQAWTNSTGSTIRPGTIITITNAGLGTQIASIGTISGTAMDLAGQNEVLYMYVGTTTVPTAFITAIANDTFGSGSLGGTGLTERVNATLPALADEDVMVYTGTTTCNSTLANCTLAFATSNNWASDDSGGNDENDDDAAGADFPDGLDCAYFGSALAKTYYSRSATSGGDWDSNTAWTLTSDGSGGALLAGEWPRREDHVVILNGHTITINDEADNQFCGGAGTSGNALGRPNVGASDGLNIVQFYHTGDINVNSGGLLNVTNASGLMLEGYTLIDGSLTTGTTTSDVINLGYLWVRSTGNFDVGDDLILSGNSTTVLDNVGTTTATAYDDLRMDFTDATLCGTGQLNLGNGSGSPAITRTNGALLSQICSGFTVSCTAACGGGFPVIGSGSVTYNTGPGGVGNSTNNVLWLKADDLELANGDRVASWPDASGNGLSADRNLPNTVTNQPGFATNAQNGLPAVDFDGGDWLNLGNPAILNLIPQTNAMSFFGVFNVATGVQGTFLGKGINTPGDARQYQFQTDGPDDFTVWAGNQWNPGNTEVATGAWKIGTSVLTTSATGLDTWVNGQADLNNQNIGTTTANVDVLVGARRVDAVTTTNSGFNITGDIAELILYNAALNEAQRIIVENYLSAKYAIALSANDIYTMDDNGNFDFEAFGVGKASDNSQHTSARGSGIVTFNKYGNIDAGEFLMAGHDNGSLASTTSSPADVDGTIIVERLQRIWRVSEVGDLGSVSVSFDLSLLSGSPSAANLRLLIDRNGNGFGDNDVTPISNATLVNSVATFTGVNFEAGDRFTLGNTNLSTPLPIVLVAFSARPQDQLVHLAWTTSSETNNQGFIIERSNDAKEWQQVLEMDGGGTTHEPRTYQAIDDGPFPGLSYYRLKQVDYDGRVSYSKIVSVFVEYGSLNVYPNPSDGKFYLQTPFDPLLENLHLMNVAGHPVKVPASVEDNQVVIDASSLPPGVYILQVYDGLKTRSLKIFKN